VFLRRKKDNTDERLPPRQRWIPSILKWGIEHPGINYPLPNISKQDWVLQVSGEVNNPLILDWKTFQDLPQSISVSDFHCVETWSVKDQKWEGVLFKDLVATVKPKESAKYVFFVGYDTYTTCLPLGELMRDDIILAHKLNEGDLPQPLGGPVRLVVPQKYAYKSAMWVNKIVFMRENKLGFWESGVYSDTADVWKNDRYRNTG
jgi:DMSO/TMAO reductase YedYZ molybdopterin-dependent catalytic subunit